MNIVERYLLTAYLKWKKKPDQGFDPDRVAKILNLGSDEAKAVVYELSETALIRTGKGFGNRLTISGLGMQKASTLLKEKNIRVLQFFSVRYVPPASRAVVEFVYSYNLIRPDISEANHSISVTVSDVAAMSLGLFVEKDRPGERILLQYAKDEICRKLQEGVLKQHEELEIMERDLQRLPKYDLARLPDVADFEFVVEILPRIETSEDLRISEDEVRMVETPATPGNEAKEGLPYLSLPVLPLTADEIKWLNLIYKKFLQDIEETNHNKIPELHRDFPGSFDPLGFTPLLLTGGTRITLYGIYHIDPFSILFPYFDDIVRTILKLFEKGIDQDAIGADQLIGLIPGITLSQVGQVFKLMASLPGFSDGISRGATGNYTIRLSSERTFYNYRTYPGLQKFMEEYLFTFPEVLQAGLAGRPSIEDLAQAGSLLSRTPLVMKSKTAFRPVMGVRSLAFDMATIIGLVPPDEKGQMIGIFGKWGRGKTFFLQILKEYLVKNPECQFIPVEFHAWKYQETPASWAYLFETLANAYLGSKKGLRWFRYWARLLWLRVNCFGVWPLLQMLLSLFVTVTIPLVSYWYLDDQDEYFLWGIIPATLLLSSGLLKKILDQYSTRAVNLIKMYGTKNSFKASMGIQADIQAEIIKLLKLWTGSQKERKRKIALIVEDIDRCSEEKIMPNIDALRVMLEDAEISQRMIIITAIDEGKLRNAIRVKYTSLKELKHLIEPLTTEYMDKLFICAIKLGALTVNQKEEYLKVLFENDQQKGNAGSGATTTGRKNIGVDGDLGKIEQAKPTVIGGSIGSLVGSGEHPGAAPAGAIQEEWKEMNAYEEQLISEIVKSWPDATPRRISIFYYRYLLSKNILIDKYAGDRRPNPWANVENIQAVLALLFHFGNCHQPELIETETRKLKDLTDKPPALPGLNTCGIKHIDDYRILFEVMELVVAY